MRKKPAADADPLAGIADDPAAVALLMAQRAAPNAPAVSSPPKPRRAEDYTWQRGMSKAQQRAVLAAAGEAAPATEYGDIEGALNAGEAEQAQRRQRAKPQPQPTTKAQGTRGKFSKAVAKAAAAAPQDRADLPTMRGIQAEAKALISEQMRRAGIKPVRIPKRGEKLRSAVCALLRHLDAGKKPSALGAAGEVGMTGAAGKKLAYRMPVKREAVDAGLCLIHRHVFVRRLRQDAGLSAIVITGHASLAKLAKTLAGAHLSLAGRAGSTAKAGQPKARGWWHAKARSMRVRGKTGNQIARTLGVPLKTVETFLRRERMQAEGRKPAHQRP